MTDPRFSDNRFDVQQCKTCGHYAFGHVIHVTNGLHVPVRDEPEESDDA